MKGQVLSRRLPCGPVVRRFTGQTAVRPLHPPLESRPKGYGQTYRLRRGLSTRGACKVSIGCAASGRVTIPVLRTRSEAMGSALQREAKNSKHEIRNSPARGGQEFEIRMTE
jgi:hypothetical protein